LSFVIVFGLVLAARIVAGRGAGASSTILRADPSRPIATDVRPNEQPTQIGTLVVRNTSAATVVLRRAFLASVTPGLGLNGFAVLYPDENDALLGGQCGPFPPPNFETHAVDGALVRPGSAVEVVVALQATREGEFTLDGIRLFFDVGSRHFHEDLPLRAEFRARAVNTPCRFDPTPHRRSGGPPAF
jgi:hypothetical protein